MTVQPSSLRALGTGVVASFGLVFVACATTEDVHSEDPASRTLTEAGADAGPPNDGGCDAADSSCVVAPGCDEVAFCRVATNIDPNYTFTGIWGSGPADVWAIGSGGTIAHYDGVSWSKTETNVKNTFRGIWGSGPNDVWAVSDSQVILHTTGTGSGPPVWTKHPSPLAVDYTRAITSIWGSSASDVRLGGRTFSMPITFAYGDMFRKTDDGDDVLWMPHEGSGTVYGIWGSSANDVWTVSDNSDYVKYQHGRIRHGTPSNGGDESPTADPLAWADVDSQTDNVLRAVWGSSASDVWFVGDYGTIRHVTPNHAWAEIVDCPVDTHLRAVWGSSASDVWFVGDAGTILHWDGTTVEEVSGEFSVGRKPDLSGVWGSGTNDVWIAGDAVMLHFTGPKPGMRGGEP